MGDLTGLERHGWNDGFTWRDHHGSPTTCSAEQLRAFDRDGFFVLAGAFSADELAPIVAELDTTEDAHRRFLEGLDEQRFSIAEAGAITFSPNLVANSELLEDFTRHPTLLGLCHDLVGPDVNLYWDQAVYKYPEKPRRFPWHQDNGYAYVEPQQYLTCWIALTDATEANGCPQVAPGLHRLGTLAHRYVEPLGWQIFEEAPEVRIAEATAGSIVVFSSLTPHLTGPNTTESVRKAYIVQYAPAGAHVIGRDPTAEPDPQPADDPGFQFPVLRDGRPVADPTPGA